MWRILPRGRKTGGSRRFAAGHGAWRVLLAVGILSVILAACARERLFARYFLTACPAEGPEPSEVELGRRLVPLPVDDYYETLAHAASGAPRTTLTRVTDGARVLGVEHLGPLATIGGPRLLVVAGVHGNEIAGTLAAPRILDDVRANPDAYAGVELHLVAPANPVGLAHLSRYDAAGCDVNRDFGRFRTPEAGAIRDLVLALAPTLIVSLHEGPQDGFYAIATRHTPVAIAHAMARAVAAAGVPPAHRSFLGLGIAAPGVEHEGVVTTALKRVVALGSLGTWADARGIGVVTTETPWAWEDVDRRVAAQVVAVRAAARALTPVATRSDCAR